MSKEKNNHIIELIPAYVLGALDADEAAAVSQHLLACAGCQREVASYQSVLDALPLAAAQVDPSPELKKRLFAQIQESPKLEKTPPSPSSWSHALIGRIKVFLNGPRWQPALVLAIIAILLGAVYMWQQYTTTQFEQFQLTATDVAPDAQGLIEFAADGREATLSVSDLPVLPENEQYQLWLIVDGQRDSGAVFSVDTGGSASVTVDSARPLVEYGAFGITIEPAGGSPGPTGQRVLGYNL